MDRRIPIACSLEGGEARQRSQDWKALATSHRRVERSDQDFRIHFAANDATRSDLARLVAAERQCCGFVKWELEDLGNELMLVVSGNPFGVTAMAAAFQLEA